MKHDAELYDVSKEARAEGISLPVIVDGTMMETLTPNPYLESLGISREQRITNLLRLTRTMMNPLEENGNAGDAKIPVPFMVLRGPFVREEYFTVTIHTGADEDGKKTIIISRVIEAEA